MISSQYVENKIFGVFGLGKSGVSTVKALIDHGASTIYAWDEGPAGRDNIERLKLENVHLEPFQEWDFSKLHALLLSPGVPLTHPKPHDIVGYAKQTQCPIICDLELLYRLQQHANFMGITGTNGKSTTTTLIGHILKEAFMACEIGGNLGIPALELAALPKEGTYVLEMSSYQLDLLDQMHVNCAVWLNISPDHIDRHGSMEGYVNAKKHIFNHQNSADTAIIGMDDEYSQVVYASLNEGKQRLIPISNKQRHKGGIAVIDSVLYDDSNTQNISYDLGDLPYLKGAHNGQNIAAAFAAAKTAGVASDVIIEAIKNFKGLRHRMQYVAKIKGITYVNDSKATNAEAASHALAAYKNIYWIAGGVAKEGGIEPLREYFPHIRHAFLIGEAQGEFASTLGDDVPHTICHDLLTAIDLATKQATDDGLPNPIILLSPACASFDQWPNFEARGDAFCHYVENFE